MQKYVIKQYKRGQFERVIGDRYSRDEASDLLGLLRSGAHETGLTSRWSNINGKMAIAFSDADQTEYIASPVTVVALHQTVVPIRKNMTVYAVQHGGGGA